MGSQVSSRPTNSIMGTDLGVCPAWAPRSGDKKKRGCGLLMGNIWGGQGNQSWQKAFEEEGVRGGQAEG